MSGWDLYFLSLVLGIDLRATVRLALQCLLCPRSFGFEMTRCGFLSSFTFGGLTPTPGCQGHLWSLNQACQNGMHPSQWDASEALGW